MEQETDGCFLEDEDQVPITACNATYHAIPFPGRLRRRNILTQQPWINAALNVKWMSSNYFSDLKSYFR